MPTTSTLVVRDRAELAWAAGFFDGEGSTIVHTDESRPLYLRLEVAVPQAGHDGLPAVLLRFQRAVGGLGRVVGPERDDLYKFMSSGRLEALAIVALLWDQLGQVKRAQANDAIRTFLDQYESGSAHARAGRHVRQVFALIEAPLIGSTDSCELELAWAAGFLDAEGCFGLAKANKRARGPQWYRVRASAAQHGKPGIAPEVLQRLRRALGDIGKIERHGDIDDFKWLVEGDALVQTVLDVVGQFLSERKAAQAREVLRAFRGQIRLKGNTTHCVRGHEYSYTAVRGGRARRVCNACARLIDRRERAKQGIAPRAFKNIARRYTE